MDLEKYTGKNNNFILWALLFVLILGFGKCSKYLGINANNGNDYNRKHCRNGHTYGNTGLGVYGNLLGGNIFGNNIVFILIVIALLFICKDKKNDDYRDDEPYDQIESCETEEGVDY